MQNLINVANHCYHVMIDFAYWFDSWFVRNNFQNHHVSCFCWNSFKDKKCCLLFEKGQILLNEGTWFYDFLLVH